MAVRTGVNILSVGVGSGGNTETSEASAQARLEGGPGTREPATNSTQQPPSSPLMDLETDFPSGELTPHHCCCASSFCVNLPS